MICRWLSWPWLSTRNLSGTAFFKYTNVFRSCLSRNSLVSVIFAWWPPVHWYYRVKHLGEFHIWTSLHYLGSCLPWYPYLQCWGFSHKSLMALFMTVDFNLHLLFFGHKFGVLDNCRRFQVDFSWALDLLPWSTSLEY